MENFFFIAMLTAMGLTLLSLGAGLLAMVKGGAFNKKYANTFMRARVMMQGVAIVLFALAVLLQ